MAYAFTAISNDASANYYNSAGLAFLQSPSVTASYLGYRVDLWPDPHYVYFAISYPLVRSAWGFDIIFFTPCETEIRNYQGVYLGTRLVWRMAPKVSYAHKISDGLSIGISWKYVYQRYFLQDPWTMPELFWPPVNGTGRSWAFDFNFLYKAVHNMSIGAVLHNIGPAIGYTESGATDPLPRLIRLGVAYVPLDNKYIKCTVSCEITKILVGIFANEDNTFWQNMKYELDRAWKGIGLELLGYRIFSVRGGYFYDYEGRMEGFTFGAGVSIKGIEFDIGIGENILYLPTHTKSRTVSISYTF